MLIAVVASFPDYVVDDDVDDRHFCSGPAEEVG
jgi:hypothetical protein